MIELTKANLSQLIDEVVEKANEKGYNDCDAYDIRIVREWEDGYEQHDYSGYDYGLEELDGMIAFINEEHVTGASLDLYANYNEENCAYETDCGVYFNRADNSIKTMW